MKNGENKMSNPNPNKENLRKFTDMTPEEHRELSKKGAIASAESKRARKSMKEMLDVLLQNERVDDKTGNKKQTQEWILIAQINKALKGDSRAFQNIRDTVGEKPVDVVQFSPTEDNIKDIQSMIDDGK